MEVEYNVSESVKLNYWKGEYSKICSDLATEDWDLLFKDKCVEEAWLLCKAKILDSCQRHILIRKEKKTKKNMWLSKATLQLIRQRNEAWKRFKRYESLKNYECYRKIRNEVVDKIRLDKLQYQDKLVNSFKGNPKKFYAYIRRMAKVKDRITRLVITGQKLTSTDEETAEVLLKEFESVHGRKHRGGRVPPNICLGGKP